MNKRLKLILTSCVMIAISIALLLTFLLVGNKGNSHLYCSAIDLEINVGETVYNYFEVSDDDAIISISVSDDNIIDIDETHVYGKSAGEVKVTLTAILGEEKSVTTFNVKVYAENFNIKFTAISDCYFEGNTLYAFSNICQFYFDVYDKLNNKISNILFESDIEGDALLTKNFHNIMLALQGNCLITFNFIDIKLKATVYVVMIG